MQCYYYHDLSFAIKTEIKNNINNEEHLYEWGNVERTLKLI